MEYTLGFVFDRDLQHVLLIQKQRPAWQAGKFNGIGGKLEAGEHTITFAVKAPEMGTLTLPITDTVA